MVTLPRTPPGRLLIEESDVIDWPHQLVVRVHGTVGQFALAWPELRHFGPTRSRFDPHPPPPAIHPDFPVMYAAADLDTALAEVFQRGRLIEPTGPIAPHLTVWRPAGALRLLDVREQWPIRQGASHVLNTGPQPVCRRWAPAIAIHPDRIDSIVYTSSMTGRDAAALFLLGADSFPILPVLSRPLEDPGLVGALHGSAEHIGYAIR